MKKLILLSASGCILIGSLFVKRILLGDKKKKTRKPIGHVEFENREDGLYVKCYLNDNKQKIIKKRLGR